MGAGYELDQTLGLTVVVFDGKVTAEQWRGMVLDVFEHPAWPPGRNNLTDLSTADTSGLTAADRAAIFEINAAHAHKLVGMKSASVGSSHFEAARKFERDDRSSGLRLIAFDDLVPACTWLGVDVGTVRTIIDRVRRRLREPQSRADPAA